MAPGSRKKLSLKKKEGGTAVGNALRGVVKTVSKVVGVGGLSANAIGSQKPKVTQQPTGTKVGKTFYENQGTTDSATPTVSTPGKKFNPVFGGGNISNSEKGLGATGSIFESTPPPVITSKNGGGTTTSIADQTALTAGAFGGDINASGYTSGSSSNSNLSSGSSSTPRTSTIGGDVLTSNANSNMFVPEKPIVDYSADIPPTVDLSLQQQEKDIQAEQDKEFKDMIAGLTKDFNNKETGAEIDAKLQKELGIKEKQEEVNTYQTQLNAIVSKGEANQLSLIGQGRGIPEAIIGGQQAQIARETAIAALPVQAQLSAAQGNLEMANDSLDRLFKIYSEDAQNEFEYKREVKKMVYEYADKKTQRKLDEIDKQEERAYQETKDLNDERKAYAKMAFENGQSSLGAKIAKLDYKSPTFKQDLANLQAKLSDPMRDLDRRIKEAQLATETAKTSGTGGLSDTANSVVNVAMELLNNPELGKITGNVDQFLGGLTSDQAKLARNKWKQLKGILSLENRQMLKGSGAISDFEFRVLGEAATALGRNLSDDTFRDELTKLITTLSPEYQYINSISGAIDSQSDGSIDISNYLNKVIGINF